MPEPGTPMVPLAMVIASTPSADAVAWWEQQAVQWPDGVTVNRDDAKVIAQRLAIDITNDERRGYGPESNYKVREALDRLRAALDQEEPRA
jgi:hypothetical protein